MDKKFCTICGKEFYRKPKVGFRDWNLRKFCGLECTLKNQKIFPTGGQFKKGHTSWNLGKTGYLSKEVIERSKKRLLAYIKNETAEQREKRLFKFRTMPRIATMTGKKGEICPNWKGESATYNSKHKWIQNNWQKTGICEICKLPRPPRKGTRLKYGTHWSNKSGRYLRQRDDWYELCPKCHKSLDKR